MYLNLLTKKIIKYTYTLRPSFSFNFFNSSKDKFDNSKKNNKGKLRESCDKLIALLIKLNSINQSRHDHIHVTNNFLLINP